MLNESVPVEVVRHFCHIATRRLGVGMDSTTEALVAGRVAKRLQVLQLPLDEYLTRLDEDEHCAEIADFLDFMRPRPARFFARGSDFVLLRAHLDRLLSGGRRRIRLWSAGCGSGEEPYAMAVTILQAIGEAGLSPMMVDWKVLASDVSLRALERGRKGVFEEARVADLPTSVVGRFFTEASEGLAIRAEVRGRVVFRRLNIAQPPFPMTGPLDAVFCHEGLLPLLPKVRRRVVAAAKALLAKDGIFCGSNDDDFLAATEDAEDELWQDVARHLSLRQGNC